MVRRVQRSGPFIRSSIARRAYKDTSGTCAIDPPSYTTLHRVTDIDDSDGVEARGNFASLGKSRGNENRRWHGTRRRCNIGDKGVTTFCAHSRCALCSIIKTSFDLSFFKAATGWGKFGAGIYTSSTSSKSVSVPLNGFLLNAYLMSRSYLTGLTTTRVTRVLLRVGRHCC